MSFNLHATVRGAIETVNPDSDGTVYISTGSTNNHGILTPTYATVTARLQVQADTHDKLMLERGLGYTVDYTTVYAYGNFSDLERPDGKGGDLMYITNPQGVAQWWGITTVNEWWPDWCCVSVTRQLNATTLAQLQALIANGSVPAP
jgi:hypothetical protein